jgi:galactokinase/mevalonate kinase-like predicted kinase
MHRIVNQLAHQNIQRLGLIMHRQWSRTMHPAHQKIQRLGLVMHRRWSRTMHLTHQNIQRLGLAMHRRWSRTMHLAHHCDNVQVPRLIQSLAQERVHARMQGPVQ